MSDVRCNHRTDKRNLFRGCNIPQLTEILFGAPFPAACRGLHVHMSAMASVAVSVTLKTLTSRPISFWLTLVWTRLSIHVSTDRTEVNRRQLHCLNTLVEQLAMRCTGILIRSSSLSLVYNCKRGITLYANKVFINVF